MIRKNAQKEGERMAVIQEFRTAVGGFNRQDVQDYIERLAIAHREEVAGLQKKLEQAEERTAEVERELADARRAAEDEAETKAALDEASRTAAHLQGELSRAEARLAAAKKEIGRLQGQVAALEPMANGYREIKDRAANVELDAHQRAQAAVNEAKAEVERIRADARKWLSRVLEQYTQLRCGLDGVLDQLRELAKAPEQMRALDEIAKNLREQGGLK